MNWIQKPSTTGGIVYLVCVAVVVGGLVVAALGPWREGVTLMALGFGLATVMRLVLPDSRAGMLRVRHRVIDLMVLMACAGLMLVLAVIIPDRP